LKESFLKFIKTALPERFLLIACGLPATGKTTACREIATAKGAAMLGTDVIRREVLKNEDVFDERVAADMEKRLRVYEEMFRQADGALKNEDRVVLDATFVTQALRRRAAEIAAKQGVKFFILQTECPRETALGWMKSRTKENYESNALTEEAYLNNLKSFESVDVEDIKTSFPGLEITHFVVDTAQTMPGKWYVISENQG